MKTFQRILAVALVLIMSLSVLGTVAFAAETIDTSKKGSIIIHKYEYNEAGGTGTGSSTDTVPNGATPLSGVTFKITKVAELTNYYGTNGMALPTVEEAKAMPAIGDAKTGTTNENGVVTFSNLDLGLYLVQETDAPAQITGKVSDFLVSIPMTTADGAGWLYDVHVFPKNSSTYASVTLLKQGRVGNGTPSALADATFILEYETTNNQWETVTQNNKGVAIGSLTTSTDGKITVSDLAPGNYRFKETAVGNGYIMDGATTHAFTIADGSDANVPAGSVVINGETVDTTQSPITVINEKPDAKKEITAGEDTTSVGEKVSYKVTLTVPMNITSLTTFTATDTPVGLDVDTSSDFTVECNDVAVTASCYSVTKNTNGGFTITFTPASMGNYAGKDIVIAYKATITDAAVNANEATNTVKLTYTDKIGTSDTSTNDVTPAEVDTALYSFTITKYKDSKDDANKLDGVKFVLYKDSVADANKISVVDLSNGNYRVADTDDTTIVTEMTTANGGNLKVSGLGNGTYKLVETKTAEGYNLLKEPITITLNGSEVSEEVINKAGFILPETGGIGTLMFIIIGGVLIAGGICLITVPSKKRSV